MHFQVANYNITDISSSCIVSLTLEQPICIDFTTAVQHKHGYYTHYSWLANQRVAIVIASYKYIIRVVHLYSQTDLCDCLYLCIITLLLSSQLYYSETLQMYSLKTSRAFFCCSIQLSSSTISVYWVSDSQLSELLQLVRLQQRNYLLRKNLLLC